MPLHADVGRDEDLAGHESSPPASIRGALGWIGGCNCLKFPSIQIKGGLGRVLPLVSHALWGETQPPLEPAAALPGTVPIYSHL